MDSFKNQQNVAKNHNFWLINIEKDKAFSLTDEFRENLKYLK